MCPVPLVISRDVHLYLSQTSICQEVTRERRNERNGQERKERFQNRTECGLKREKKERRNRRRNGRKLVLWEEAEEWLKEEVRTVLKNIFSRKEKKGRRKTRDEQEKKGEKK